MLRYITLQIGNLLGADRATIYLINQEKTELWSVVAENQCGEFLDIQVRLGEGITGKVAQTKEIINIPDNVYQHPYAERVKESDQKYGYYTENLLAFPILDEQNNIIAVLQLLNKLNSPEYFHFNYYPKVDQNGFPPADEERLAQFVPAIRRILESFQSCYQVSKKLRATAALAEATRYLDHSSLDTKDILQRVMNAAKKLMNADRSTLWLVDRKRGDLWTQIPKKDGSLMEKRVPLGEGFVGQVAQHHQPLRIPFDVYEQSDSQMAQETDKKTGYRTCSLLCMPVFSPERELLGVTQLLNKRKPGNFPPYNPAEYTRNS